MKPDKVIGLDFVFNSGAAIEAKEIDDALKQVNKTFAKSGIGFTRKSITPGNNKDIPEFPAENGQNLTKDEINVAAEAEKVAKSLPAPHGVITVKVVENFQDPNRPKVQISSIQGVTINNKTVVLADPEHIQKNSMGGEKFPHTLAHELGHRLGLDHKVLPSDKNYKHQAGGEYSRPNVMAPAGERSDDPDEFTDDQIKVLKEGGGKIASAPPPTPEKTPPPTPGTKSEPTPGTAPQPKNTEPPKSLLPGFDNGSGMVVPPQGAEYVLNPGTDVAKDEVVLTDTSTQKEIPGGKVVIIPADPKEAIPPPIRVTSTGKVTLPEMQPHDRIVILTDNHAKVVLEGSDLPTDKGTHLAIPAQPLRLIVHDTPCAEVTDRMVDLGLADQYAARIPAGAPRGWNGTDYRFAVGDFQRADCVVNVPDHVPLQPGGATGGGKPVAEGGKPPTENGKPVIEDGGPVIPKDGPTITDNGKVIEGDQPRKFQGSPPTEPFAISRGSWGQAYPDQWYLGAVRWLKPDGTTVLPEGGTPVTVAVIDTGVDFTHPELAGAKWINPDPGPRGDLNGWNFVDNSSDIGDLSGHGTIVAGIIAASTAERFGIAGINPWARIVALKVLELDGNGGSINLAQAIVYAADHGARVINLSVGGRTLTRTEQDAVDYAARRDALVVVASGNEGIETTNFSPAGLKNVLAVAAIGPDLKRQAFSNWGATIGIAAPGVDILSLRARQTDLLQLTRNSYKSGAAVVADQFYRVTGSSFAAPIVSGAASLLLSVNPTLTAVQVKRMLMQSARDLDGIGTNQFEGYGLLDIAAALAADPNAYAEAAITGVAVAQLRGQNVVRVSGSADADNLKEAHVEIGAGDSPVRWAAVAAPIAKPVINGVLADIPVEAFKGGKQWTLRVIVLERNGLKREARFKLTLG